MQREAVRSSPTWGLAVVGACTLLYALASLALPFGWDHDIIASVSSSYIHGGLPYVDSWDMKGPVAYLPFAAAELLFGPTMWGVRLVDALAWAVAGFVLYDGVRALTTWRIGVGTALVCYLWIASAGWFFTAAPESWVTTSCILAIVPLLWPGETRRPAVLALSGFLIACSGLVKPFYFCFGLAPLVYVAFATDLSWWGRLRLAVALAAGAAAPPVLVGGYFWLHGGLAQAIEVHLLYPLTTYVDKSGGVMDAVRGVAMFLRAPPVLITTPFALLALWSNRSRLRLIAVLVAWLGVAVFCVALQKKYFVYHWFPVYPPLFILGALGAFELLRGEARPWFVKAFVVACAGLVLAVAVARPMRDVVRFAYYSVLKQDHQAYLANYTFRLYDAADEVAAARYISQHTRPDDRIFIWGSDGLYFLADRRNPTRFTFAMPLFLAGDYRDPYRAEAMAALSASPPAYFVTGIEWDGLSRSETSLAQFPAMARFLSQNYTLEKQIGVIDLYRRRDDTRRGD